jgi:hypothetical protein
MNVRSFTPLFCEIRGAITLGALAWLASAASAQVPVTDRPFNNAPGVFRFAIVADRAGGIRPGVFENAVVKLMLMQPEFVMSVGDLIDGYTKDPKVWNAEWQEFEKIVTRLDLPFYYVPGNHDISNPELLSAWKQRRGDPWFSFVYQNVLFLCLDTEDRPGGGFGDEQIAWAKRTLASHADVRWTLLFFHRPLWMEKDQAGYEQVSAALHGRPYTVFAGHLHHYLKSERDGMKHYVLATTGGVSKGRGVEYGEFDHVTWVTMKPDGPVVANLKLDGILPDDVVSDDTYPRVEALREGTWLRVEPVVQTEPNFQHLPVPLRLRNPTDYPLQVSGQLSPAAGVRFEPAQIDRVVAPQQTETVMVDVIAQGAPVSIHALNEAGVDLILTGSYPVKKERLELPTHQRLRLDWRHTALRAAQPIQLDGNLGEWPADAFTLVERPMFMEEGWEWFGPEDGRFRFAVQHRDGKVFVAIETFDDHLITAADPAELQDKLMVKLQTSAGTTVLEGVAGRADAQVCVRAAAPGLVGEFAFTLPPGEKTFRLNIGWQDHDRPENTKPSVLWWRDGAVADFGWFTIVP